MLLERGINPNSMSVEPPAYTSVLDNMLLDEWICKDGLGYSDKDCRKLKKMIKLLIAHGGKKSLDLHTEKLKKYLVINALYPTGLVTWDGYIDIQNLLKITQKVESAFLRWKKLCPVQQNDILSAEKIKNKNQLIAEYNIQGMNIAKSIKKLIEPGISVRYINIE